MLFSALSFGISGSLPSLDMREPCLDRIVLQHRVDISSANVKQEISTLLRLLKVNISLSDQNAPQPRVDISSANVKQEISTLLRLIKVNVSLSDQNATQPRVDISSANVKQEISTLLRLLKVHVLRCSTVLISPA